MRTDGRTGAFLTARWLDLVMLNYEVDAALLAPHVPAGTTLDLWDGHALVSLVGFRFVDTRLAGIAVPGHTAFEEVNLRFYVRRVEQDEVRRAVVFIRELVPRLAIAWVARAWYNEPYRATPMRHTIATDGDERRVRYEWREPGGWTGVLVRTHGEPRALVPGEEAEFITEHYWGYTRQRDGSTIEYRVEHPSWRVWKAVESSVFGSLDVTYGAAFGSVLRGVPRSAFVAEGSPVTVYRPTRLSGT
jgi:uncharacterized protein YqjF (DUF2071 family)